MKNFEQLKIWQKGFDIAVNAIKLTSFFPQEQKFGLALQITKNNLIELLLKEIDEEQKMIMSFMRKIQA